MEDEFQQFQRQPPLLAGGEAFAASADDAYLNSVCGCLSFRTLLTCGFFDPSAETANPLKLPKTEPPLFAIDDGLSDESTPYNFFSDMMPSSLSHHLPSLISYGEPQNTAALEPPILNPRAEMASYRKQLYGRQQKHQKQRLSDKTRCLQKLLPWEDKMDMATVLEEAYKYIKFLQAQVSVLQSMPCESNIASAISGATSRNIGGGGDLGRLNRQQLLQVVVNSPVAQKQFYSKGFCLYSMEQLILLKKNAERKALYHQMMLDSSINPNSFLS